MAPITVFVSLLTMIIICRTQWVSVTDNPLPRSGQNIACATYADSIFIMGGRYQETSFIEYKVSSDSMIDHGSVLQESTFDWGMYYIQWQNTLYVEADRSSGIKVYDLASPSFPDNVYYIPIDTDASYDVGFCVAASDDCVFLISGWGTSGFNILTLSDNTWSMGPSLQTGRLDFPCIVVSDYLYAISGYMTSNERININTFAEWKYIGSLTLDVALSGVAAYDDIIWVVGGRAAADNAPVDYVWNIDTTDGSVIELDERLPYSIWAGSGATLIANDVLYVFGGRTDDGTDTIHWMKRPLTSETTTTTTTSTTTTTTTSTTSTTTTTTTTVPPTENPTNKPTNDPTVDPTNDPTDDTTTDPTDDTTTDPTDDPTTDDTTTDLTDDPTTDPTNVELDGKVDVETTKESDNEDEDEGNVSEAQISYNNNSMALWIVIGTLLSVVVLLLICGLWILKSYKKAVNIEDNVAGVVNAVETGETGTGETQPQFTNTVDAERGVEPGTMHVSNVAIVPKGAERTDWIMNQMNQMNDVYADDGEDSSKDESLWDKIEDGAVDVYTAGPDVGNDVYTDNGKGNDVYTDNGKRNDALAIEMVGCENRMCTDCGQMQRGKLYEGLFYCSECWKYYDEIPFDGSGATTGGGPEMVDAV